MKMPATGYSRRQIDNPAAPMASQN